LTCGKERFEHAKCSSYGSKLLIGHSTSEKVKSLDALYGRERDKYHIRKFNTFYNGMNRTP
jgi:hypothetical protein